MLIKGAGRWGRKVCGDPAADRAGRETKGVDEELFVALMRVDADEAGLSGEWTSSRLSPDELRFPPVGRGLRGDWACGVGGDDSDFGDESLGDRSALMSMANSRRCCARDSD